jgi:hypothetical protein
MFDGSIATRCGVMFYYLNYLKLQLGRNYVSMLRPGDNLVMEDIIVK